MENLLAEVDWSLLCFESQFGHAATWLGTNLSRLLALLAQKPIRSAGSHVGVNSFTLLQFGLLLRSAFDFNGLSFLFAAHRIQYLLFRGTFFVLEYGAFEGEKREEVFAMVFYLLVAVFLNYHDDVIFLILL